MRSDFVARAPATHTPERESMGEDLGHTVYNGPEGETTEWGDIQRRIGNFAPLPAVFKPDPWAPATEGSEAGEGAASDAASAAARDGAAAGKAHVNARSARELEDMEDEFADDGFLEEYRCARCVSSVLPPSISSRDC